MKILIGEEDPVSAAALEELLCGQGHQVTVTRDGIQAWNALQREVFSLVFLDWRLTGYDGLEVCRKIRTNLKSPYRCVILLTARDEREDRIAALNVGVDVFLTKPLHQEDMIARLQVAERILMIEQ